MAVYFNAEEVKFRKDPFNVNENKCMESKAEFKRPDKLNSKTQRFAIKVLKDLISFIPDKSSALELMNQSSQRLCIRILKVVS